MHRSTIALLAALCSSVTLIIAPAAAQDTPNPAAAPAADLPNIIFFLSDDQRDSFLGCAGHPIIKTPHIDALAAHGVRFVNTFATTSICAASRASIFTGLHERTHRFTFGTPPIRADLVAASYPALLRAAGYRTGFVGKFGVGVAGIGTGGMFDSFVSLHRSPYFKKQPDGSLRHLTDITGDKAIDFVRSCPEDQPFCLSVSFNAAHAEDGDKENHFPSPPSEDGLYEDLEMPLPRLSDPTIYENHPDFLKNSMNRDRYFWRWDTPEKYQKNIRGYYRMITGLDRNIGRVLAEIDARGLTDKTVVIFASDNGYYKGDRGFSGKWSHYEESLRIPLVVADPRAPDAAKRKLAPQIALNIDIPATILDLANVPVPDSYQGHSLLPLVRGTTPTSWREDAFCEHLMDNARIPKWEGVRGSRFVYARYFEQDPPFEFLHDVETDPDQLKNLAGNPEFATQLREARTRCDQLRDSYGGVFKPHPKPQRK